MRALPSMPSFTSKVSVDPFSVPAQPSIRAKTCLSMREAKFEDYPQIAALEAKYGLEAKSYEEWKHLWSNNLVWREYQERLPIGWVLEDENRSIIGSLGNIPL